jgi:hypothetical protein
MNAFLHVFRIESCSASIPTLQNSFSLPPPHYLSGAALFAFRSENIWCGIDPAARINTHDDIDPHKIDGHAFPKGKPNEIRDQSCNNNEGYYCTGIHRFDSSKSM